MTSGSGFARSVCRHDLHPYEAAFLLGLSVRQLGHRLTRGDIAFGYAGRLRRVPVAEVRDIMKQSPLAQLAIDAITRGAVAVPRPTSCTARPIPLEQWAAALLTVRPASSARDTMIAVPGRRDGSVR
jgi:hypothetical protein